MGMGIGVLEGKKDKKTEKSLENSCFEVLNVLFLEG
jgi:hypothetical protein